MLAVRQARAGFIPPGGEAEALLGVDHVVSWERFAGFIDSRWAATDGRLVLYVDHGGNSGKLLGDEKAMQAMQEVPRRSR